MSQDNDAFEYNNIIEDKTNHKKATSSIPIVYSIWIPDVLLKRVPLYLIPCRLCSDFLPWRLNYDTLSDPIRSFFFLILTLPFWLRRVLLHFFFKPSLVPFLIRFLFLSRQIFFFPFISWLLDLRVLTVFYTGINGGTAILKEFKKNWVQFLESGWPLSDIQCHSFLINDKMHLRDNFLRSSLHELKH